MSSSDRATLLSQVAEALVTAGPESIDALIEQALARTGRLLEVDRCSLFLFSERSTELELTHGWEAKGVPALPLKSMSSVPAAKLFPRTMEALLTGRALPISDTRRPDKVIQDEGERLLQLGIRAILLVPMFAGERPVGLIGIDRASAVRDWSGDESTLLDNLGQFLTHALLRVRAEQTLRQVKERYQALTEKSQSILFEVGRDGRYNFVSSNAEAITSYRADELVGRSFRDFLHPEDLPDLLAKFRTAMTDSAALPVLEYRVIHGDESVHWHRAVLVPLRDECGSIRGVVGTALDITDLKELESHLRGEAALTALLVRMATHYINLPIRDFESAIARSLRELGQFVGADRAYVFRYDREAGVASNTHEWCAAGITPQIEELRAVPLDQISDFAALHQRGEPIHIAEVSSWPHEGTREILAAQHVQSLVSVPLMLDGECLGFVGFDYVRAPRDYSGNEIHLLTVFAQMLVNMRVRGKIERQLADERRRLGEIIDGTDAGTWEWNLETGEMRFNHRWAEMLGVASVEDLPPTSSDWAHHVHPDDARVGMENLIGHLKGLQPNLETEIRVRRADGSWLWILVRGRASHREADGRARLISGIAIDIQQRKQAEAELRKAASVFTHSGEGILITDLDNRIVEINEGFTRITGYPREEILGRKPSVLSSGRHDEGFYSAMWRDLLADGYWSGEIWNRRRDGTEYAQRLTISTVRDDDGKPSHYVGLFADITAQKNYQRELERMAHYDSLTGLPNRILLGDRLSQAMSQARRNGQQIAVAYIDLDNFKSINDRHGHRAGDQVLRAVAQLFCEVLRETDTVARPGGDEFVAILTGLGAETQLDRLLQRLLHKLDPPIVLDEVGVKVSLSIGVTLYPQVGEPEADQLLRQADQAMFEAKRKGRNNVCYFDTELERSAQQRRLDQIRLRQALADDEFALYYQPQVDLQTGRVQGVEALIRWIHPDRGLLAPAAFLPMIEDPALAVELGQWVIERALQDNEHWRRGGLDLDIAVNVDAADLLAQDFTGRLQRILADHPDFPVRRLMLEVVETSMLEDISQATAITRACQGLGVAFALDDFGTGFSSLSHLKHLPLQQLKIDRSFVSDMMSDADDLAIVEAVINLGQVFSLDVLAEGVESDEHVEALMQLGCRLAQGYRIARPMPANEICGWVEGWKLPESWRRVRPLLRENRPLLFAEADLRCRLKRLEAAVGSLSTQCPLIPQPTPPSGLENWLATHGQAPAVEGLMDIVSALIVREEALLDLCRAGRQVDAEAELARFAEPASRLIERLRGLRSQDPGTEA
ncbi:EAL domain-containing protein [Wenzhouxiangella limi]|uniref:EAL domain-containing protein n=1 Tax=Wenzhouxiangella limi TaxID=2707351 RepID=A0A845UVX3_9GAMM|nr:EAL domain-containing protein [Wenzhouxiangella limi]NDY95983.1 EAL domain-containing protein [Wenzhouxiangella limi]